MSTILQWKICVTVLHAVAISSASFRVAYRYRTRQLGLDEYVVAVPLVTDCLYVAVLWLRKVRPSAPALPSRLQIALAWLGFSCFIVVVWFSRVVLALSIARICPVGHLARRISFGLAAVCACSMFVLATVRVQSCLRDRSWETSNTKFVSCPAPLNVAISAFCVDVASDLSLVAISIWILWRVRLPRSQRHLVLAVFSASIWTTLATTTYMLSVYSPWNKSPDGPIIQRSMPHLQAAISLIVCNLSVVVAFFYRTLRKSGVPNTDSGEQTSPATMARTSDTGFLQATTPTSLVLTEISYNDLSVYASDTMDTSPQGSCRRQETY
ncbi:hypothetical protein BD779DRAFT_1144067 [Infundibulicybe gibba]|nr:hypothetical protein BD779DRAFT_1144067 [Infundibulicybe gibba]